METQSKFTATDWAFLSIRIIVGIIFMAHGAQKLFGAFGGHGLEAVVQQMGPIGYLVTIGEFFGGLGLILGLLPRFSALANIVIMIGAIVQVHGKNGFFAQSGGFEYNLALIGLLLPILIAGPGRISVSEAFPLKRREASHQPVPQI
ncbi:MAG TPA: DoxX family protein [Fimbriimonas sp.]